jgi:hypothetical protein
MEAVKKFMGARKSLARCPGEGKIYAAKIGGKCMAGLLLHDFRCATPTIWG